MTQQEHLKLIRAFCVRNLEIASKRTPGEWVWDGDVSNTEPSFRESESPWLVVSDGGKVLWGDIVARRYDAAFIATCAGAAEAGWKATIIAVDALLVGSDTRNGRDFATTACEEAITAILAAWPLKLLKGGAA